ncbi:Hint domain-containing protein [Rhodovulum sp. YNF3179]|uniref:Hint domain-containing protein n=1 Tax=Rhodovulum sp. YNF3179 TaxID=3425127 RepID=UPI003D324864
MSCHTPHTAIETPDGPAPVQMLCAGDRVVTRDHGTQTIRWVSVRRLDWRRFLSAPHMKPVLIQAGALGPGTPARDMMVSPNHRFLVGQDHTFLPLGGRPAFVAAKHLVDNRAIHRVDCVATHYIHFTLDTHAALRANGCWSECYQPAIPRGDGQGNAQRNELFDIFPELMGPAGVAATPPRRTRFRRHAPLRRAN